jgi:hypothetical protein
LCWTFWGLFNLWLWLFFNFRNWFWQPLSVRPRDPTEWPTFLFQWGSAWAIPGWHCGQCALQCRVHNLHIIIPSCLLCPTNLQLCPQRPIQCHMPKWAI